MWPCGENFRFGVGRSAAAPIWQAIGPPPWAAGARVLPHALGWPRKRVSSSPHPARPGGGPKSAKATRLLERPYRFKRPGGARPGAWGGAWAGPPPTSR